MEICSGVKENHDEIIFDSKNCPLCAAFEEIKRLEKEVKMWSNDE